MGRTLPTFRITLEKLAAEWAPFRRSLRTRDREAFDSMMNKARLHASSSSFMVDNSPLETIIMSILVEQEKEIMELRRRVPPDRPTIGKV